MAYVSKEMKAEITPVAKALCKKYGVKATLKVENYSALTMTISKGKIDFLSQYNESTGRSVTHIQVNPHSIESVFESDAKKFLLAAVEVLKGPRYFDESDAMSDYFHCSHYVHINIGSWNKPYLKEEK